MPKGGCFGLRTVLASKRWSGLGQSDPDKRELGHKALFLITCLSLFLPTGGPGIGEHLLPTPAVTPAPCGVQGGQNSGWGWVLKHETAGSSLTASPEAPSARTLHSF